MSVLLALLLPWPLSAPAILEVHVGSKQFTESVILGEIGTDMLRHVGVAAVHQAELGGTRTLWSALVRGDIDVYPEYTGTLAQEILREESSTGPRALQAALRRQGIRMSKPLGFNNTYAIGMPRERAKQLGIRTISDLASHPELQFGFSNEFMDRADGWPGLRARYALPQTDVRGLDHDLAYRGLEAGDIDVTDLYATDAEIRYYDLTVLKDDRAYFPNYEAVWLYRAGLTQEAPTAVAALQRLQGRISRSEMAS
ncbi:MAG TPA: glycine betaine ABC transporter substrate-binding protein, partial [Gammaproteobacteria bacterium]|nr:glycine betaine ABC transporter substrate-binding protein [Gammaproteobacteria bacterium]